MTTFAITMFIFAVAFILWAIWQYTEYHNRLRDFYQTTGTVKQWKTGSVVRKTPFGFETLQGTFPEIVYSVNDKEFKTLSHLNLEVNTIVKVWYDSKNPQNCEIFSKFGIKGQIFIYLGISLFFILLGIIFL